MLLTNGRIYTLDARGTIADTLVVRDGRVAFAGRRADVVVLSEDVLACDEVLIPEIRPVLTLVGGEIVYRASRASGAR